MPKKIKIELVYRRFTDSYEIVKLVNIVQFVTRCNNDYHEIEDTLTKREVLEIIDIPAYEVIITGRSK